MKYNCSEFNSNHYNNSTPKNFANTHPISFCGANSWRGENSSLKSMRNIKIFLNPNPFYPDKQRTAFVGVGDRKVVPAGENLRIGFWQNVGRRGGGPKDLDRKKKCVSYYGSKIRQNKLFAVMRSSYIQGGPREKAPLKYGKYRGFHLHFSHSNCAGYFFRF